MSDHPVIAFLAGAVTMANMIAGLFFLRFWRSTRESLFLSFGIAFWLLAVTQAVTGILRIDDDRSTYAYLARVAAFLVILFAIIRTNIRGSRSQNR